MLWKVAVTEAEDSALSDVLSSLADAHEELVEETCARIHGELASYAHIEEEALGSAVARNLRTALTALQESRIPAPGELTDAAVTARERYFADVPVEEIVRGFRISIALIHERFVDLAVSRPLPSEVSVAGVRTMWGVADSFTTRIITEYHDLDLHSAFQDAQRRITVVGRLLSGEGSRDPSLSMLDPNASYASVRADVPAGENAEQVRCLLQRSGSTPGVQALVVTDGASCFGVVAARPNGLYVPIGLGPFGTLTELPISDRTAKDSLWLAQRLGRRGVQSVEDLGWRLAAASRPDVWQHYAERFLVPVMASGNFGEEILAAIRSWLENAQSIPTTARQLMIHANTVRYRLRRFEELTGADLTNPDDRIGIRYVVELGHPDEGPL